MSGREVFRHAVGMVTDVMADAFAATGTGPADLDWFVPHQANRRIIDASAEKLGISPEKSCDDRPVSREYLRGLDSIGPWPLLRRRADQKGDLVMIEAMGGGFTWGSALIRW